MAKPANETPASAHITLRNLVTSRWVLLVLVFAAAVLEFLDVGPESLAAWVPAAEHPLATFTILGAWAGLNLASVAALRLQRASEALAGAHLLIDATALTLLLVLAGGSANPFTILYFLPLTLATQVSPRWTWALAGWSLACFASLFVLSPPVQTAAEPAAQTAELEPVPLPTPPPAPHIGPADHAHHSTPAPSPAHHPDQAQAQDQAEAADAHHGHFEGHQRGMWIAFGLTGVLMTVFVHRTALGIARQRAELIRLRQAALEDRHLTAIGTLAAGAAHELGTPLGTIKLLVDELPLMDPGERDEALTTVREQLARCKLIVSRMANPEPRVDAYSPDAEAWPIARLGRVPEQLVAVDPPDRELPLEIHVDPGSAEQTTQQPFEVLAQLLREFVANAAEACRRADTPSAGVHVDIRAEAGELRVDVRDTGVGMDAVTLAAAFDPFFSTRPEGSGMGLGLYIARAQLRQLGGRLELDSELGVGTTVHLVLPLASPLAQRT
jgi:two-component system sensor histidine kinase RegB